jgi:hypothetical protein
MTATLEKTKKSAATLEWERLHPDWDKSWIDRFQAQYDRYESVRLACFPKTGEPINLLDYYDALADVVIVAASEPCEWQYREIVPLLKTVGDRLVDLAEGQTELGEAIPPIEVFAAMEAIPPAINRIQTPRVRQQTVAEIIASAPGIRPEQLARMVNFTGINSRNMVFEEQEKPGTHCNEEWRKRREVEVEAELRADCEKSYPGVDVLYKAADRLKSLGIGSLGRTKGQARPNRGA